MSPTVFSEGNADGRSTSTAEVTNVSSLGIWLLAGEREYFLAYDEFPWFRNATIDAILDVKLLRGDHLHWPKLDVDLGLESLDNVENYPLVYK